MQFKKALIIDDDDLDVYVAKRIIENHAFAGETASAHSVKEAMEYLESHKTKQQSPDIIFLDLNMPGQTGLDFLTKFSVFAKNNKIASTVALLMNVVDSDDVETIAAKSHPLVNYVIEKPLTEGKLAKLKSRN